MPIVWQERENERAFHLSIQPEDVSWGESSAKWSMAARHWQTAFWSLCHENHRIVPSASWYNKRSWRRIFTTSHLVLMPHEWMRRALSILEQVKVLRTAGTEMSAVENEGNSITKSLNDAKTALTEVAE